jgi:tetratricopeptide (TPR) repeat protein
MNNLARPVGRRISRKHFFESMKLILVTFIILLLMVPAYGQQTAADWHDKGLALFSQGRIDDALQSFEEAVKLDPNYAKSWYDIGIILGSKGRYVDAIKAYENAIRIDPYNAKSWWGKGAALGILGQYDEAVKALDESIRLNPNDAEVWNNKGYALYDQGKYDEAIKCYDEALRLNPNFTAAQNNKVHALGRLGQRAEPVVYSDPWMNSQPSVAATGHTDHGTRAPPSSNTAVGNVGGSYLANSDTKVYHYPSCAWAQKILPENRIWFSSPDEAVSAGYRPCEKCNPP